MPARPHLEYDSEGCPRARRPVPCPVLHTWSYSPDIAKNTQVHRSHSTTIFLVFMGFPFPIQASGPHTQAAPSMSAVPTHPRGFSHMLAPFPHTFPQIPQPHTPAQIPIDSAGSPYISTAPTYNYQAPKIRLQFQRNQRFRPRKPGIRRTPQIPCVDCWRGTACPDGAPTRRYQRPVHADPRINPVCSNSPGQRQEGMDACDGDAPASTSGGPMPVMVRPGAGSYGQPEGWPWNRGPPGGGQPRGGICESFPGACRVFASGLR